MIIAYIIGVNPPLDSKNSDPFSQRSFPTALHVQDFAHRILVLPAVGFFVEDGLHNRMLDFWRMSG